MEEQQIKNAAALVFKTLGAGFCERVYHNAIEVYLRKVGTSFKSEHVIPVKFMDVEVGNVRADLVINDRLVVELKVGPTIKDKHTTQCFMYMKLLKINNGLIINFPLSDDDEEVGEQELVLTEDTFCKRCGRDNHSAESCYAKKHLKGYFIN
jgi:GxxExxY protein